MPDSTTATVTSPFDRVTDVDVVMSVIRPQAVRGLGNLLILNASAAPAGGSGSGKPTTPLSDELSDDERLNGLLLRKTDPDSGAMYREYKDIDAVRQDFDKTTDVYKKANIYFAQPNHSDRVAVLDYQTGKERDALGAFWNFNWTFAVRAKSDSDNTAIVTLANIFEANKDHFLVIQSNSESDFTHLQGQNYVIGLKHNVDEPMDAALVGAVATLPVGSTTWKFKTLNGITPDTLTSKELASINRVHAIGYTTVAGKDQTTEGKVLSGEYIDTLHGVIWVKSNFESDLEKLLQNNNKIPYEQTGINMILATGTQVLNRAYEQGIIANTADGKPDFTISASSREEQSAQDRSDRHYGGISFAYHASSAVHSLTVHGSVNSDTIMNN